MKCPYLVKTISVSVPGEPEVIEYEPENEDVETQIIVNSRVTDITTEQHSDCIEEDCAAWYDGRCGYRG